MVEEMIVHTHRGDLGSAEGMFDQVLLALHFEPHKRLFSLSAWIDRFQGTTSTLLVYGWALHRHGIVLYELGDKSAAEADFRDALQIGDETTNNDLSWDSIHWIARVLYEEGTQRSWYGDELMDRTKVERAENLLRVAMATRPDPSNGVMIPHNLRLLERIIRSLQKCDTLDGQGLRAASLEHLRALNDHPALAETETDIAEIAMSEDVRSIKGTPVGDFLDNAIDRASRAAIVSATAGALQARAVHRYYGRTSESSLAFAFTALLVWPNHDGSHLRSAKQIVKDCCGVRSEWKEKRLQLEKAYFEDRPPFNAAKRLVTASPERFATLLNQFMPVLPR